MKKLIEILCSDLTSIRFFMGILSFIAGLGFIFATTGNSNYAQLLNLVDQEIWGSIFILHGIGLLMTAWYKFPKNIQRLIHLIGIWVWSYLFLSFTIYDSTPTASTEWMLIMPMFLEFWLLTENIFKRKT